MADTLEVRGTFDDRISPALKHVESGIIRVVGAFSALSTAMATIASPIIVAADFQKQLLEVQKTTDYTSAAVGVLGKELVTLSKSINVSASELAKIAALGGQLGIGDLGVGALKTFTEEIARAVTALDVSAEEATTSFGKLRAIFDIPTDKFANVIATVNQISNVSTARPEELFDILRRIGNLGGSVTVDQATALSAVMIDLGLTAETAGTSLTKVFADMKANVADFSNFVGLSTAEWSKLVETNGVGALKLYLETLNRMPPAVAAATKAQLTGEGRLFGLITKLQEEVAKGGGLLSSRLNAAADEYEVGTSAIKEQQNVLSGLSAQWQVLKNNVAALGIAIGNEAVGPLTAAIRTLSEELGKPETVKAFTEAAKTAVEILQSLAKTVTSIVSSISSIGIDWSRMLNLGVLLLAVKGVESFIKTVGFLAGALRGTSEPLGKSGAVGSSITKTYALLGDKLAGVAEKYRLAAIAAQESASAQVAAQARVNLIAAKQDTVAAARRVQNAAQAYADSGLNALAAKSIAGTITATERTELAQRLHTYRAMIAGMGEALKAHQLTEMEVQKAITATQASEVKKRLIDQLAAMRAARLAQQADAALRNRDLSLPDKAPPQWANPVPADALSKLANAAGLMGAYSAATSRAQKALVLASAAVTMLGKAIGFVASRLLGWVSMALIVYELGAAVLEALGWMDKLKDGIRKVYDLLGIKNKPEFLKTEQVQKDVEKIQAALDEAIVAKQKFETAYGVLRTETDFKVDGADTFDKQLQTVSDRVAKTREALEKRITFDITAPEASVQAASELANSVGTLRGEYDALDQDQRKNIATEEALQSTVNSLTTQYDLLLQKINARGKSGGSNSELESLAKLRTEVDAATTALTNFQNSGARSNTAKAMGAIAYEMTQNFKALITYMDPVTLTKFFGDGTKEGRGYLEVMSQIKTRLAEVQEAAKPLGDLNQPLDPRGKTDAQINQFRDLQVEYRNLKQSADAYRDAMLKIPELQKLILSPKARGTFLDTMVANAKGLRAEMQATVEAGQAIDKLAVGRGVAQIPVGTSKETIAAALAVAIEYRNAMSEVSKFADAKAKDAAGAVARAIDKNRQDLREFQEFVVRLQRNSAQQADRAVAQNKVRAIDDGAATRQTGLANAKALENDILNMIKEEGYIDRNNIAARLDGLKQAAALGKQELAKLLYSGKISADTYNKEVAALSDSVRMQEDILSYYDQRGAMTSAEAAALQKILDLKYKAADRQIVDDADAQKAKVNLNSISDNFRRLQREATEASNAYASASSRVSLANTPEDSAAAIKERDEAQAKAAQTLALLRAEAEKFSQVEPVAGKIMVPPEEVKRMQDAIKALSDTQAQLSVQSAGNEASIYTRQANDAKAATASADAFAQAQYNVAQQLKVSNEELAKYIAAATKLPEVQSQIAEIQGKVSGLGQGVFPALDKDKVVADVQAISAAVANIKFPDVFTVSPDQIQQTIKQLTGAVTLAAQEAATATKQAPLEVDAKLNIVGVNNANLNIEGVSGKKDGGPIVGAGTSRSDSILHWLSHGEWVMDARTVRMFGGGFFASLQSLARSGTNLSGVQSAMGAFASGGPSLVPGLPGIPTDGILQSIASESVSDTVAVDISLNGSKRARMRGARSQVNEFVDTLREVQKGMAR